MGKRVRTGSLWLVVVVALAWLLGVQSEWPPARHEAGAQTGPKSMGGASCAGSKCHGSASPQADYPKLNESLIWQQKDKHAKAFETLTNERLKSKVSPSRIAKNLNLAKAETSDRCLVCHAVNVKRELRGPKFDISDGVHCEGCHGPAENWLEKHAEKGWTHEQSVKLGMYDTKSLLLRAEKCVSCHLAIDAEMVAAGHPELLGFELATFSRKMSDPSHWRPEGPLFGTRAWAVGQVVALREAARQVAERAKANAPAKLLDEAAQKVAGHAAAVSVLFALAAPDAQRATEQEAAALVDQVKKGDKAAATAAATKIVGLMNQQAAALARREFSQGDTQRLVESITGGADAIGARGGRPAEQAAMALDRLSLAYYRAKGQRLPKNVNDALDKVFDALPEDLAKYDAKGFAAAVKGFGAQFGR